MDKARGKLEKEVNIIEIIKSRRYFESALKYLLPKEKRFYFKERSRYQTVDPDSDTDEAVEEQKLNLKK